MERTEGVSQQQSLRSGEEETNEREMTEEELEEQFTKLISDVDVTTRETLGFRRIQEDAEDSGDYKEALKRMRIFLAKREDVLDHTEVIWSDKDIRIEQEDVQGIVSSVRNAIGNPDGFLGNGSVAEVYTISANRGRFCVKWIIDYARYAEGVPVEREVNFLDELQNLVVDGVRAPRPVCAFSSLRMKGIVMEKLHATNFRRVIEGQTTEGLLDRLPPNFDVHRFFNKLENYVKEMHARGIYHGDLHLRNMMIDRETGDPYIIDFGKSTFDRDIDKASPHQKDYAANDREALRLAKIEAVKWISESAKRLDVSEK